MPLRMYTTLPQRMNATVYECRFALECKNYQAIRTYLKTIFVMKTKQLKRNIIYLTDYFT